MEKGDPVMIVSDNDSLRDAAWEYFSNIGYSCNFERDLEGAEKRVAEGVFKIIVIDIAVTTRGQDARCKPPYWEWLWGELQIKWSEFTTRPIVRAIKPYSGDECLKKQFLEDQFLKSLDEIQASFFIKFL